MRSPPRLLTRATDVEGQLRARFPTHNVQRVPAAAQRIALQAQRALELELATFPKPGLVSHRDSGSHDDMDASTFQASILVLVPFFAELAGAGSKLAPMETLRAIGLRAEAAMMRATGGVNTHRGAIFGIGLLCAAAGAQMGESIAAKFKGAVRRNSLGLTVREVWGPAINSDASETGSNGSQAFWRYGAGGARSEAAAGFPSVYRAGLPGLRLGRKLSNGDEEAARVQACFALVGAVEDTNLLHRGGEDGARYARNIANRFLAHGGVGSPFWKRDAAAIHHDFVMRRLSPGGCADLLSMTLLVDALGRERQHGANA